MTEQPQDDAMVFDPSTLAEVSGGDDEFEREVIGDFLDASAPLCASLANAIRTSDQPTIQRCAHTLKGSSLALGAKAFGGACKELELAGRGDAASLSKAYDHLTEEYARLEPLLRERLRHAA